jgi:hypothetical protein
MALHEVQLKGYSVRPGNLSLGTFGSYGIEQLHVTLDDTWSGLAVTATFNPPKGEPREIRLPENGLIDVPAEATANEGTGTIVYCGVANGVQRITKTQGYNVITRGPVGGTEPFKPSESLATQVLQAALNAEKNSAEAKSVADNLRNDAANGKFDGKDGAKGDKGDTGDKGNTGAKGDKGDKGFSPTAAVTQLENGAEITITDEEGTTKATVKNGSKGDKGDRGSDGVSPTISVEDIENGHRVTIVDATGTTSVDIYNGEDGTDGKDGAQVDDSSIGDKPWSSKHIIDMLCPPLEESGNPVVCYPVAGYALGVKAKWEPLQEGTGTPSPENIRPIKGRDCVTVERCGANLSKISDISTPNKTLTPVELPTEIVADIEISFDTLNAEIEKVGTAFFLNKADGKWKAITVQDFGISTAGKIPNGRKTAVFHGVAFKTVETVIIKNGYCKWSGNVNNFCVSYPKRTYTPYNGQTNTLTLPETVYGGEVDAVTGDAKGTWQVKSLDGTEGWAIRDTFICVYNLLLPTDNGKAICTHFDVKRNYSGDCVIVEKNGTVYLGHALSDKYTVDTWRAYLAAQNAAGTPVQIVYKLAEPVPFTATGAQPIPALAGVNTVLTDADSATVTGRADPIKRITDLEDAVASQT